ncbi:MAG: hypothetical protein ABIK37_03200 [candidate division WOR-3 bacterium]
MPSFPGVKLGRLLWTGAVTFYSGVFFRNFLADADIGGSSGVSFPPMLAATLVLLLWMAAEYYVGVPFFQSGFVEPVTFLRALFALFVYPYVTFVVADRFWWNRMQIPAAPIVMGILGLVLVCAGSYIRLASLFGLLHALRRQTARERRYVSTRLRVDLVMQLRLYRLCRQPRYLGTLLQVFGIAMVFNSWGGLLLATVIGFPLVWAQARGEDRRCWSTDVAAYAKYAACVPLLIPRLRRQAGVRPEDCAR